MFNLVLFGPPGAGKGTQSRWLIAEYGFHHICPGDMLREEVCTKTVLGKKAQAYIDKGLLAPNELVVAIVEKKMKNFTHTKGFLFDGYPRTHLQASMLDKQLKLLYKSCLSLVIVLNVDKQESRKRIKQRSRILCRVDDRDEGNTTTRMLAYQATTLPVLDYYKKQRKVVKIEGKGSINQVSSRIKDALGMHFSFE